MSLLSSLIAKNIVQALEKEFLFHSPGMQSLFLDEVTALIGVVSDWIENKIDGQGDSKGEDKTS